MNENKPDSMEDTEPAPTEEQRVAVAAWLALHPYGEQDENGIDLGSIRENLRRTPSERLRRLQDALENINWLRKGVVIHGTHGGEVS